MRFPSLAAGALLLAASLASDVAAQDTTSPESTVLAAYEAIGREPGEPFDWDRFRSLFLPEAHLIPNLEQTGGVFQVLTVEQFIGWISQATPIGGPNDRGFYEYEVSSRTERYGDIANVFSTYAKRWANDTAILGRGINSFQLVLKEGEWLITSIIWDEEVGAGPIPSRYGGV